MDTTKKFSGLADFYERGRPAYSDTFLHDMFHKYGLSSRSVIADVGSGTGIFARQMLEQGAFVFCVEPNDDMRGKAEESLRGYKNCRLISASAEASGLADASVDAVTAAQAFHWFDGNKFRNECQRILRPGGKVFLVWNMRDMDASLTLESYDICRRFCPRFKGFGGGIKKDDPRIAAFFGGRYERTEYDNPQYFDLERFIDRSLSGSYSLHEGDQNFALYLQELKDLFGRYAVNGILEMPNKTAAYISLP